MSLGRIDLTDSPIPTIPKLPLLTKKPCNAQTIAASIHSLSLGENFPQQLLDRIADFPYFIL